MNPPRTTPMHQVFDDTPAFTARAPVPAPTPRPVLKVSRPWINPLPVAGLRSVGAELARSSGVLPARPTKVGPYLAATQSSRTA